MKLICSLGALVFVALSCAQGGPPLLTDDPGTVEAGKYELNLAWINRQVGGSQTNELPHFDINRRLSNRAHLKVEIPWTFASNNGFPINGDGGASVGVKYRFQDGKGAKPAISMYPAIGFSLSKRSIGLGLSEGGTSLDLPFQVQWDLPHYSINADGGLTFSAGGSPGWIGGVALGKEIGGVEFLAEIHGEGVFSNGETGFLGQLGLRKDFTEQSTLLIAFGKTIAGSSSERTGWASYVGVQLRF